ncbi:hypothetical protein GJAV_G00135310 [Gymnothorax javanicus]|nr:hypothetical protein GJAV_G00135310 [Gymnothorax javanicus]
MVMSQGTYTFLACFAGFWLVWALVVMLCCFCSFVQRRLKRRREDRLQERCLRTMEMEPLEYRGYPHPGSPHHTSAPPLHPALPPLPPHSHAPLSLPPNTWTSAQETEAFGKPPCYEEAVLMDDPPPPYSEVLSEPRGGTYTKPPSRTTRKPQDTKPSKSAVETGYPERPFSSLIHLPVDEHWDSLGRLLSAIDLNRNNLPATASDLPAPSLGPLAPGPRRGRTNSELWGRDARLQLDHACPLPTAFRCSAGARPCKPTGGGQKEQRE